MVRPLLQLNLSAPLYLFGVAAIALAGCAGNPITSNETATPITTGAAPSEPVLALEYHILAGELAVQRGNREVAAREYVAALAYSDNPELAQRAARVALFAGEPELAYQAAKAWAAAALDSADAHKTAARLALRSGAGEALALHAQGIVNNHSNGIAAGFKELTEVLSGEPEHAEIAMQAMQNQVAEHAQLAEAYYAQGLLALRYENLEMANQSIRKALEVKPNWPDAVLLRAGILVRQARVEEASTLVSSLGGNPQERAEYHLSFARLLLETEQTAQAADEFERVLALQPDNADARYGLGLLALSLDQPKRAERAFKQLYKNNKRRDNAAYYLANIAMSRQDYTQARTWYDRVKTGAYAFDARVQAARALYKTGDLPGARAELDMLRQANPELADRLYMAEAELLYDAQEFAAALQVYNQALEASPYDSDLLYGRSLVYERLGQFAQAQADLMAILEREPDDARTLNALGYMLTNNSQRYEEALQYIQQALDAEPEDPAIIDSMGWVQYRLGNLEEAREHLQKAYKLFPDPEVAAHLGEVLHAMGENEQAQALWRKALAENPDNPVLLETIERLAP